MSLRFLAPCGAVADAKELEYIAALHQTCSSTDESFTNASIDATDIKHYLMSRHGIAVSKEHVRKVVLSGLGGGDSEDDCLDIAEVVAVLVIPTLLSVARQDEKSIRTREAFLTEYAYKNYLRDNASLRELDPSPSIIGDVLRIILINVTGSSEPPLLTKKLVSSIFAAYDELELLGRDDDDDLLDEMVRVASGGRPDARLDEEAFERALTDDVKKYNANYLTALSTFFEDAFGSPMDAIFATPTVATSGKGYVEESSAADAKITSTETPRTPFVFASTDFTAETYRSRSHSLIVWLSLPVTYYNFLYASVRGEVKVCGDESIGCQVAMTISHWVIIMLFLTIVGGFFLAGLSLGNHKKASILENVLGIVFVVFTIIVPNFVQFDFIILSNKRGDENVVHNITKYLHVVLGGVLIVNQLLMIVRRLIPEQKLQEYKYLGALVKGSEAKAERAIKQAAEFKVNKMIKNAYNLHFDDNDPEDKKSSVQKLLKRLKESYSSTENYETSSHSKALLNFTSQQDDKELIGGFFWTWKQFFSGDLVDREGIWIHGRILAANVVQIFVLLLVLVFAIFLSRDMISELYPPQTQEEAEAYAACVPVFNPDQCYFPSVPLDINTKIGIATCYDLFIYEPIENGCDNFVQPLPTGYQQIVNELCVLMEEGAAELLAEATKEFPTGSGEAESKVQDTLSQVNTTLSLVNSTLNDPIVDGVMDQLNASDLASEVVGEVVTNVDSTLASGAASELAETLNTGVNTGLGFALPDFKGQCPEFYISDYYAVLDGSNDDSFCVGKVTVCARIKDESGISTFHCVLGFSLEDSLPGMFIGDLCETVPEISELTTVTEWLPKKWMIDLTFGTGIAVVILTISSFIVVLIPSTVATILKFRTGVFETLKHPNFNGYRTRLEDVSFLLGIMFWGIFFSCITLFVLVAGAVFLAVWQITRPLLINFAAPLIGLSVTIVFKMVLIHVLGKVNYAGFYRRRPAIGNAATLALECWHVALTIGYMIARVVKIMLCAGFYIGRVDTPILAEGGPGDKLDKFPHVYRKELLSAEAHRHPYIERLGFMYLMKLRYGDDFGRLSGSIWRLLFVFALMPWLRRYRIQNSDEDALMESLIGKLELKMEVKDENPGDETNYAGLDER